MKNKLLLTLLLALCCVGTALADSFVNLTPKPKTMTVGNGEYVLPSSFSIATTNLSDEMKAEVSKFVVAFNFATGYEAAVDDAASDAIVRVGCNENLSAEGYTFNVDATGVKIDAATPAGLFYALQTFKKILPTNVMAGVKDAAVTEYALPYVSIADEPRYEQRGFMLDVSRHFFTVEEVKRMLDLMACYKMNSFHWHLTDDQGWRVEIKKWPKLTEVGSIAPNCRKADIKYGQYYWTNEPYGPYFYTQDELREVVAYAKERHIEVIPEIDMPGHFVAALVAYPEFSCNPNAARSVWVNGGISSDVLNVANPAAVDFVKDILAELIDIFPSEYIHIGGDECPTSAWEGNADCQKMVADLGLANYRQLQSHFIKEVGDFIKLKGRKVAAWNEAITAGGADTQLMQDVDALIYCWTGADNAANKAQQLGLKSIYTPQPRYYINRKQRADDLNAGDGSDNLRNVYAVSPNSNSIGIQGTFWAEHVSEPEHLEYQALPRLIAIAEAAWTPQTSRNFDDFCLRITADSTMLNYNNYTYNRDYMNTGGSSSSEKVMPVASTSEKPFYYRIVTRASDANRSGRCWELLREGSPLITGSHQSAAGKLWSNAQAAEGDAAYDYQLWGFEPDPNGSGQYALVCKAQPDGSLNPTPSATSTSGRWTYDSSTKHYEFILGEGSYYGQVNGVYYYSIRSSKVNGQYLNSSLGGQGFAINCYGNPADGNGGLFLFNPMSEIEGGGGDAPIDAPLLTVGTVYSFTNTVAGFEGVRLSDNGTGDYLTHSSGIWSNDAWEVTANSTENGVQSIKLKNVATGRTIGSSATASTGTIGFPVSIGGRGATLTLTYNQAEGDYTFASGGKNFFPVSVNSPTLPGIISSGSNAGDMASNAFRPMGTAWQATEVAVYTYNCSDSEGHALGTFVRSIPAAAGTPDAVYPEIKNYKVKAVATEGTVVSVTYERESFTVIVEARDEHGALLSRTEEAVNVGKPYMVNYPEHNYYQLESTGVEGGTTVNLTDDQTFTAVYSTEAYSGVKAAANLVSNPVDGRSYLIYDNSDANNGGRKGFRTVLANTLKVNRVGRAEGATPYTPWTFEKSGEGFKLKNEYLGLYVPSFGNNVNPTVSAEGDVFVFTQNADGSWKIKGSTGQCWDGQENGNMVGWNDPGHPHLIYEYFAEPYFEVLVKYVNTEGTSLAADAKALVKAGSAYTLATPSIEGYAVERIEGNEALDAVGSHTTVKVVYSDPTGISGIEIEKEAAKGFYDLSGRKLNQIGERGIYIVNGKKVLVK